MKDVSNIRKTRSVTAGENSGSVKVLTELKTLSFISDVFDLVTAGENENAEVIWSKINMLLIMII